MRAIVVVSVETEEGQEEMVTAMVITEVETVEVIGVMIDEVATMIEEIEVAIAVR